MDGGNQQALERPDYTRAQVVAVAQAAIAVGVAFGVPITDGQSVALVALAGVIGAVLIGADASIRRERARNADKLTPTASLTRTEGPGGVETTAELTTPASDLTVQQFHTALRAFLKENGLVLAQAPKNGGRQAASRR